MIKIYISLSLYICVYMYIHVCIYLYTYIYILGIFGENWDLLTRVINLLSGRILQVDASSNAAHPIDSNHGLSKVAKLGSWIYQWIPSILYVAMIDPLWMSPWENHVLAEFPASHAATWKASDLNCLADTLVIQSADFSWHFPCISVCSPNLTKQFLKTN